MTVPLVETAALSKHFPLSGSLFGRDRRVVRAVDAVSLTIEAGEVVGLVGESGSGKSTLGRTILRLEQATAGRLLFDGRDVTGLAGADLRALRRRMQMVFQDPYSSLNPRMTIEQILATPLRFHERDLSRAAKRDRMVQALETVGLPSAYLERYPHEFSGGQRQRIGIARALIIGPDFLVADEAVSALDVSVQAQVLNLFGQIRRDLGLTILFITHDLAVVGHLADRVAVMYLGNLVEVAPTLELFSRPRHPYTAALLSAAPSPDPRVRRDRTILKGDIPSPASPPSGCVFRTRCPFAVADCAGDKPTMVEVGPRHAHACIRDDVELTGATAQEIAVQ